jgi:ribosomal protein S12 methylthiotransferase accessory factor
VSRLTEAVVGPHLMRMVGPTSIVRSVRTILNAPGEPRLFSVASVPSSTEPILGADVAGSTGAMAETWEEAAVAAIGECVERYCCAVQPADLRVATAREVGDEALTIDDLEIYDPRQYDHPRFPFARQVPDLPVTWAPTESLVDGHRRLVPACLVYIPYVPRLPDSTDMLALSVSSGQACHSERTLALLSGICEVIERDAFMITWMRRIPATRLRIEDDPELAPWFAEFFGGSSLDMRVYRLASDIAVPTILCVARGVSEAGPFACVGASTRPVERDAVRKAVVEAAQGAVWVRDLIRTLPDWEPGADYRNVRDFPDHVRLYGMPEMVHHLDFLDDGGTDAVAAGPRPDVAAQVQACVDAVTAVGLEPYVTDITSREVAECGLHVVKVMIPGTAQLYAMHGLPHLGSRRYTTVPQALGLDGEVHRTFNPVPHPFP